MMSELPYPITLPEMIYEVRRECEKRREVFDRLVRDHRMNRRQADRRIRVMDAVLALLELQQKGEDDGSLAT